MIDRITRKNFESRQFKMIQFNFGSNCPSGFREDDFKKLTNRQTLDEQILVEKLS